MGPDSLCLLRGGGDLATGVAWRLTRAGMAVVVAELADPLTIRRTVALSSAVTDGVVDVEGMVGRLADDPDRAVHVAFTGEVGVVVCPKLPDIGADVVVDARVAKRNIDTSIDDASLVVGLGPGFTAGVDCHAVVETMRGPHLGRVIWEGAASPDTGTPGSLGGADAERVLRAPVDGEAGWDVQIGDRVRAGQTLGSVGEVPVRAGVAGLVRGLIRDGRQVSAGLKIGDIDPRPDARCDQISDKALAVGGGVLEAVMAWPRRDR